MLVGVPGIEPGLPAPKAGVLPVYYSPLILVRDEGAYLPRTIRRIRIRAGLPVYYSNLAFFACLLLTDFPLWDVKQWCLGQ